MSMFNGFLSGLVSGDQVKITQKNGQVIVGTVTANDKDDSIMLSISTSVVMRYDAIDSISILSQQAKQNQTSVTAFQPPVKTVPIPEKQGIDVKTGNGLLRLIKVKPEGKGEMLARDWANGIRH